MSNTPLITVIIPCFRQAEYLPDALYSLLAQEFTDWEALVVDDGSPDNTGEVVRYFAARHAGRRVRLSRLEPNQGAAGARNAGFRRSESPLVAVLDSDDALAPTFLSRAVEALDADPRVGFAYADSLLWTTSGLTPNPLEARAVRGVLQYRNQCVVAGVFRREAWEQAGGYNPNMIWSCEDWDMSLSIVERGRRLARIPEPLFHYRMRPNSRDVQARERYPNLKARLVHNHPGLYSTAERSWADMVLALENAMGGVGSESQPPGEAPPRKASNHADISVLRGNLARHYAQRGALTLARETDPGCELPPEDSRGTNLPGPEGNRFLYEEAAPLETYRMVAPLFDELVSRALALGGELYLGGTGTQAREIAREHRLVERGLRGFLAVGDGEVEKLMGLNVLRAADLDKRATVLVTPPFGECRLVLDLLRAGVRPERILHAYYDIPLDDPEITRFGERFVVSV